MFIARGIAEEIFNTHGGRGLAGEVHGSRECGIHGGIKGCSRGSP